MTTFEEFAKNAKNIKPVPLDELSLDVRQAVEEDIEAGKISEELHKKFGIDIEPKIPEDEEPKL